jgi:quinol monooxygenase YgiN
MHAVVFQVNIKDGWQGDADAELDQLVSFVRSMPGFVRGTWTTDGKRGLSFILFDNEESARAIAVNAAVPPEASVVFRSADVYQVARDV